MLIRCFLLLREPSGKGEELGANTLTYSLTVRTSLRDSTLWVGIESKSAARLSERVGRDSTDSWNVSALYQRFKWMV